MFPPTTLFPVSLDTIISFLFLGMAAFLPHLQGRFIFIIGMGLISCTRELLRVGFVFFLSYLEFMDSKRSTEWGFAFTL